MPISKPTTIEIGQKGEQIACEYLRNKGYQLIAQNYHAGHGEIDLIMEKSATIIFVEVKTRHNTRYGLPQEAVTDHKKRLLIQTAQRYLLETNQWEKDCRFDVVAIVHRKKPVHIEHFPNAFSAEPEDFQPN